MPVGEPTAGFLVVWEILSRIVAGHARHKRDVLDRIVEPAYRELRQVHEDYKAGFLEARDKIRNGILDEDLLKFLQDRRLVMEAQRREMEAWAGTDLPERIFPRQSRETFLMRSFYSAILAYFGLSSSYAGWSFYSDIIQNIEATLNLGTKQDPNDVFLDAETREAVLKEVDALLQGRLENAMRKVTVQYTLLKSQLSA